MEVTGALLSAASLRSRDQAAPAARAGRIARPDSGCCRSVPARRTVRLPEPDRRHASGARRLGCRSRYGHRGLHRRQPSAGTGQGDRARPCRHVHPARRRAARHALRRHGHGLQHRQGRRRGVPLRRLLPAREGVLLRRHPLECPPAPARVMSHEQSRAGRKSRPGLLPGLPDSGTGRHGVVGGRARGRSGRNRRRGAARDRLRRGAQAAAGRAPGKLLVRAALRRFRRPSLVRPSAAVPIGDRPDRARLGAGPLRGQHRDRDAPARPWIGAHIMRVPAALIEAGHGRPAGLLTGDHRDRRAARGRGDGGLACRAGAGHGSRGADRTEDRPRRRAARTAVRSRIP